MKTKIALNFASLAVTFSVAITFTFLFVNSKFEKKNNPQAQQKIYEFMQKEQNLNIEMFEKSKAVENDQVLEIWKRYKEEKFKLDTSELPDDFRDAWEKKIYTDLEWINFFSYFRQSNPQMVLKTDAQIDIFAQNEAQSREADREFDLMMRSYGIGYGKNGEIIKK